MEDMQTVDANLGGRVVELTVGRESPEEINTMLNQLGELGYLVILNIYTSTTATGRPWYWDGSEWVFPQQAIDTLQGVADHPALFAIYALHEPLDNEGAYIPVDQQRELYQLLKAYTNDTPVFTDIATLSGWEERGVELTDGICDYCCTFPTHFRSDWTSEQSITEALKRMHADLATQQRLMPNSQVVFLLNTYSYSEYQPPFRLPNPEELAVIRNYACTIDQPVMYYPWTHSHYDLTLMDAPQLWPIIASGCGDLPSDISGSNKTVDRTSARIGDTLIYTLTVKNSGDADTAFIVTDTLGFGTAFVGFRGMFPGSYAQAANVITWTGVVGGASEVQLALQATIYAGARRTVTNTARFVDKLGGVYTDTADTLVVAPELTATQQVEPNNTVLVGTTLTYVIAMRNRGQADARVSLTDSVPLQTIYIDGSAQVLPPPPAQDLPQYTRDSVTWSGDIAAGTGVTVAFQVQIRPGTASGTVIDNVAWIDELYDPFTAVAYQAPKVVVAYGFYLPLVLSAGDCSLQCFR
jgi:uncharacterized repeat protein (TIGR01451 family)